jgi:hypothetical protein
VTLPSPIDEQASSHDADGPSDEAPVDPASIAIRVPECDERWPTSDEAHCRVSGFQPQRMVPLTAERAVPVTVREELDDVGMPCCMPGSICTGTPWPSSVMG